ncbi:MAG: TIM-barrel domain-containing protein [Trueperaceae bacterium]
MIIHRPYGIDDPYKWLPTERFPRDPLPGDTVRVGFETPAGVSKAWVAASHDVAGMGRAGQGHSDRPKGEACCLPALSLGQGRWTVDLGTVGTGTYDYTIHAEVNGQEVASEEYSFDVGHWVEVAGIEMTGVAVMESVHTGVNLTLQTTPVDITGEPALLSLSFPRFGVCRYELLVGSTKLNGPPTPAGPTAVSRTNGLPCQVGRSGAVIKLLAPGIEITIDGKTLEISASIPGAAQSSFRGSLRSRWLLDSQGRVSRLQASFVRGPDEWLYGLGERFADANRSGQEWDVRVYEEYQEQEKRTYLPVPFLVSNRNYGIWLDSQEPSHFDLRASQDDRPECTITRDQLPATTASLSLHILVGEGAYDITSAFTELTGEMRVPPKWAFGPWMSANTWNSQAKAEEVVRRTVEEGVPASVIVLEAWSDESTFYIWNDAHYEPKPKGEPLTLADFEFGGRWPDPKRFIDYCHEQGIRVVLWQIPVQKKLEGPHAQHDLDEAHMLEQGYFIRNEDGTPYRNKGWWFTDALVVDFTNPKAGEWWFAKRRYLLDELGIDGMKTDGGEHLWGRDLRAFDGRRGLELFNSYANIYVAAYHEFIREVTSDDGVTFSRAGYTGAQRWPCHWAGDEGSTWKAYRASIQAGLSAGLSGISMWAWDIAGFSGEIPSPELYLRATAMATFCPLMQYHSEPHGASECRDRTPWNIAERHNYPAVLDVYRRFAQLRMRLLDYIYAEAEALSARGVPLMRYPALEFPEQHDFLAADPHAYLLGRDLLVAPVVEKGVATRAVRLPPGKWLDLWSGARFEGSRTVTVPAPIDRIPVFVLAQSPRSEELLAAAQSFGAQATRE